MARRCIVVLLSGLVLFAGCRDSAVPSSITRLDAASNTSTTTERVITGSVSTPGIDQPSSTEQTHTPRLVTVRYRSDPVDIAHPAFSYLNTTGSSLVNGAWYDASTGYMVINLDGTYYHYCGLPPSVWSGFRTASSAGSYFNATIKGQYGCQGLTVPDY